MAEVTRVPLQPIASGSMMKFWLGVLIGAALAGAVAWFLTRPDTVDVEVITAGTGPSPQETDAVFVEYVGKLADGTVFDQSPPRPEIPEAIADLIPEGSYMELQGVVPGFREAILQMQKGGKYKVEIPAALAYGANPPAGSPIPPNADLTFEVTLHEFLTQEQLQERVTQINTIMAAQQPEPGATPAPAPTPTPGQ
ncbi:FKBP-type peptidyl-prolyl cis-trans isomerase [Altererythrobacter lauratis]|uniref:Peptidyl-prolyl cis-trans isomerase n=1 Tax=Alteraurantiacibacter lauratis TaxID=2054627 RepID=A0ABV7EC39_9SPHN